MLPVKLNPEITEIILYNIIDNSIKFTKDCIVEIKTEKINNNIRLTVSDTGEGIPPETMKNINSDIYKPLNKSGGIGLGLRTVRSIIKKANGTINIESTQGKGTTIKIELPLSSEEIKPFEKPVEITNLSSEDLEHEIRDILTDIKKRPKSKKILLAEDNEILHNHIKINLLKDYEVLSAYNGIEALEILKNGSTPDLIISDIMMPKADGIQFFDKIKESKNYDNLPFMFLTAVIDDEEKARLITKGAIDYIEKPFRNDEFLAKINSIFNLLDSNSAIIKNGLREKLERFIKEDNHINPDKKLKNYNLTEREIEIINYMSRGMENKEIAKALFISTNTVSNHISNIYKKTNSNNRLELISRLNNNSD